MKNFEILENGMGECQAVKQGWSWGAFFFNWIWAIYKKLPLVAIIGIIANIGIVYFYNQLFSYGMTDKDVFMYYGFLFAFCFIFGINGNKWVRSSLIDKDYKPVSHVFASTPDQAVIIFMQKNNKQ